MTDSQNFGAAAIDAATLPDQMELDLSASVIVLTLPAGIYALTVKSGGAKRRDSGRLTLPAVQVSLAPVDPAGSVDFIMAPSTLDRCLVCQNDVIMIRITGGEASLLLTSLRPPDAPIMAIDFRRLDVAAGDDEDTQSGDDMARAVGMPQIEPAVAAATAQDEPPPVAARPAMRRA